MNDKDYIEQLFSEKLSNFEVPVNPNLWNGVASSITNSSVIAAKTGMSLVSKVAISLVSLGIVGSTVVYFSSTENRKPIDTEKKQVSSKVASTSEIKEEVILNNEISSLSNTRSTIDKTIINEKEVSEDVLINDDHQLVFIPPVSSFEKSKSPTTVIIPSIPVEIEKNVEDKVTVKESMVKESVSTNETIQNKLVGTVDTWQKTNVFSPNNDGVNDIFYLKTNHLKEFSISILNEKNQVVFQTQDPNFKWDGTDTRTGEIVPAGNYSYILFAVDINNQTIKQFNMLTISK